MKGNVSQGLMIHENRDYSRVIPHQFTGKIPQIIIMFTRHVEGIKVLQG